MKIILIRHARPCFQAEGWITSHDAKEKLKIYNNSGIVIDNRHAIDGINKRLSSIENVYCSRLKRAIETAKLFKKETLLKENGLFNEFGLEIVDLPLSKFSFDFWVTISRVLWFLGFGSKDSETYRQAKERATEAARFLSNEAILRGEVCLIAHGFLNYFISKELKKQGWRLVEKQGKGYLKYCVYQA